MNTSLPRLVRLVLFIALLAGLATASTQGKPYLAIGGAQFTSQNDFVGAGHATHLGQYTEAGHVDFTPTSTPGVLDVVGSVIYTAANGDELHALVVGQLDTNTGVVTATVTYVGGTGRFSDASGSSALAGQMLGGGALAVRVAGDLSY